MVGKKLNFTAKNEKYGFLRDKNTQGELINRFVYSNGEKLEYGDPAEIISAVAGEEFIPFMKAAISEGRYYKEHYWFVFGYQPADYDDDEIKESDVRIHYAGVDNTISKMAFYELCLLLCEAKFKPKDLDSDDFRQIHEIKCQIEEKLKVI
jgi:hypothetical protein